MEAPATPSGSSNGSAGAPSLLTSHPLVDYLLSLEEGGSLTPQVLNLLFAALLGGPPSREVGAALAERIVQIKRPNTLPVLLAAICHFPEHERKDRTKTQEQRDKLNNVYMDGLTLLDKLAAKSVSNLALCVATQESFHRWRLPCALLDCLPQVQNQQFLVNALRLVQTLGNYSVYVRDIKQLLLALKKEIDKGVSTRSIHYLKTLKDMTHRTGPHDFFHFDGQQSGMKVPPLESWPSGGYTYCCWFRVEDFHDPKLRTSDHSYEPRLLSVLSDTGSGLEVFFVANDLFMVTHHAGQQSTVPIPFNHSFRVKAWYFIAVRHVQHRWSPSEVQLFVNGKMVNNSACKYPGVEGRAYAWIGTNMKIRTPYLHLPRASCFYGQMGCIYVFKEALKDEDINNLDELGPNYVIGREQKFDEEKGLNKAKLLFGFQPKATREDTCVDIAAALTPSAALWRGGIAAATSTSVPKGYHATLLPGSTRYLTMHAIDAIHCSGGLLMVLPLLEKVLSQRAPPNTEDQHSVSSLISDLLLLLSELLVRSGPTERREWIAKGGFQVLAFLLERAPVQLLDETVLQALNALVLSIPSSRPDLLRLAYDYLFLNFDLWTRCGHAQQKSLLALIIQHAKKNPKRVSKLFPWQTILDVLRQYYPLPALDASSPSSKAAHEEITELRSCLIEVMRLTVVKGVPQGHMDALIKFLNDRVESSQLHDILGFLAYTIAQTIGASQQLYQNLHRMFEECGGCLALIGLLGREDEEIKRKVLLLLTSLMQWSASSTAGSYGKQLRKKLETHFFSNQCSFIAHHLSPYPLTAPIYAALFAFLVEDASFTELDGSQKIKNKQILSVIFALLPSADIFLQQQILQDFNVLLSISEEARECFLSQWGWQKWMINVLIPLVIRSERREWQRRKELDERKKNKARELSPESGRRAREKLRGRSSSLPPTLATLSNSLSSLSSTISSSFSFLPSFSPTSSLAALPATSLPVVASSSPSSPREEEAIKELVLKLIDLILSGVMERSNGWKEVEQMRLWLQLLCVGGRMRNNIQRSIYSHILGNIKSLVRKKGYTNMNPFKGGAGQAPKRAAEPPKEAPKEQKSSWWSGFTKSDKKDAADKEGDGKEGDLASPFFQNFVHIVSMCEEFLITDMKKEAKEEEEEEALLADEDEEPDEVLLKKKRKHKKDQLLADFGLMEQALYIFDCLFWDQALLAQAAKQHLFHIKTRRFLQIVVQITLLVIDRANLVLGTDRQKKSVNRMAEFQEVVTNSKQRDPLVAEMNDYLTYFLVQKKEQHKIQTNAMRMVLLENVQRLRLLFPFTLVGSKPNSYSPERLLWALHHLLKAMRRALRDDGHAGWDPTWDGIAQIVRDLLRENLGTLANSLPPNVSLPADLSCLDQTESPERFIAYIGELNSNFELLEIITAAQKTVEDESGSVQALEARMKKGISNMQQAIERERESNSIHESRLRKDIEELQQNHSYAELNRRSARSVAIATRKRMIEHLWKKLRHALTNERSPWAEERKKKVYWKLDAVEDHQRRRMRLIPDEDGGAHEEASWEVRVQRRAQQAASPTKRKGADDEQGKGEDELFQNLLSQLKVNASITFEDAGSLQQEEEEVEQQSEPLLEEPTATAATLESSTESALKEKEDPDWVLMDASKSTYVGLELEQQETVIFSTDCQMVRPLQVIDGRLDITKANVYFFIRDRTGQEKSMRDRKWPIVQVDAVHRRRYLLRWNALEVFLKNRKNYMFQFPADKVRKKVFDTLVSILKSAGRTIEPTRFTSAHPQDIMQRSGYTQAWVERRISNFEYLMYCNTIAGRTYNDLTQYPVFPWVLADYESDTIDLNDPKVYRDLSKPVGALEPGRLQRFIERYEMFDDPQVPKFHYGSHYSSVGSVLYYLLRLQPFSRYAIKLQGGTFDHPDRQFHSIWQSWQNVLTDFSDVKELTPEFFYLPEFLTNSSSFDLGIMQSGHKVDDVMLPPWASSAEEFIRIQREALESDYVSQNLHHWIDLIFGYKQRGPAAVASHNLFYFLTYEGAVDLESIKNDVEREAVEVQIANFGQTPSQLFLSPHPSRNPPGYIFHPSDLKPFTQSTLSFSPPLVMQALPNAFFAICARGETYARRWLPEGNGQGLPFSFEASSNWSCGLEAPFAIINSEEDDASHGSSNRPPTAYSLACVQKDNAFCLLQNSSIIQTFREHRADITCFASSKNVVVSGSKDTCVIVWNVISSPSTKRIDPTPRHILRAHDEEVTCVAIAEGLDLVVSGSKDGTCVLHALFSGKYLRTIRCESVVERLGLSGRGEIVICTQEDILLYSINGELLARCPCEDKFTGMQIVPSSSTDGPARERFLVTAGNYIVVRRLDDLVPIHKLDYNLRAPHTPPSPVTAFSLIIFPSTDDTKRSDSVATTAALFVGLLSGEILMYAIDPSGLLRGLDDVDSGEDDEYLDDQGAQEEAAGSVGSLEEELRPDLVPPPLRSLDGDPKPDPTTS